MPEKQKVDYSLYLVTDRALSLGRSNLEIIEAAVSGGVTLVQLREKEASTQEFYKEGSKIKAYLEAARIPLIINDRIDIALALDSHQLTYRELNNRSNQLATLQAPKPDC